MPQESPQHLRARLLNYLASFDKTCNIFRVRTILIGTTSAPRVFGCVMVPLAVPLERGPSNAQAIHYSDVTLHEQLVTETGCWELFDGLEQGFLKLESSPIEIDVAVWSAHRNLARGLLMPSPGTVLEIHPRDSDAHARGVGTEPLVSYAGNAEYFSDIYDAAKYWLEIPNYNGASDARNGKIQLLLPERRAHFGQVGFLGDTALDLEVLGTRARLIELRVKGFYLLDGRQEHLRVEVDRASGRAQLAVPSVADRVELVLVDSESTVYDVVRWARSSSAANTHDLLGTFSGGDTDAVGEACATGESQRIEFKPFFDMSEARSSGGSSKLEEVVRTVVAFANAEGGSIFIGINDWGELEGDRENHIGKATRKASDVEGLKSYLNMLTSKLRARIEGLPAFRMESLAVDEKLIGIVHVEASGGREVIQVKNDAYLYVRKSASNIRVAPRDWDRMPRVIDGGSF